MKQETNCYPQYKKLLKKKDETPVTETKEFKALTERYPHIAESVRLKDEMRKLKEKLKSAKERQTKSQIRKDMNSLKAKLRREEIRKKLHGEDKLERTYHARFIMDSATEKLSSWREKSRVSLKRTRTKVGRRLDTLKQQKLPPSLLDLKSLYLVERNVALKEWVQNRRKRP
jgi:hypothetical protein